MIRDYRQGVTSGRTSWSLARVLRAGALAVMAMALVACGSTAPESASTPTPSITVSATPSLSPTATTAVDLSGYLTQKLIWTPCRRGLQCSTLSVPINYLDPSGGSISLALVKRVASGTRGRIGSLVVNPGGPGGSGVDYVINNPDLIGPDLRKVYDTVGFDPRGVNRSAPIRCLTPAQSDAFYAADGTPDSDAEATAVFLVGRKFAQSVYKAYFVEDRNIAQAEVLQELCATQQHVTANELQHLANDSATRARLIGVKTDAMVIDVNSDGTKGYYSVFWVKADSPYKTIQDLKGKNLGIVDPNSASGYTIPLFTLDKMGIVADKFFAKVQSTFRSSLEREGSLFSTVRDFTAFRPIFSYYTHGFVHDNIRSKI